MSEFQDRCLKPLGHPSVVIFQSLRTSAAGRFATVGTELAPKAFTAGSWLSPVVRQRGRRQLSRRRLPAAPAPYALKYSGLRLGRHGRLGLKQRGRERRCEAGARYGYASGRGIIFAFRRQTLLPLDNRLSSLQASIPTPPRSALHRCLQRHDISRLPEVEGETTAKTKFKSYPIAISTPTSLECRPHGASSTSSWPLIAPASSPS
jgi:hypothetical protein